METVLFVAVGAVIAVVINTFFLLIVRDTRRGSGAWGINFEIPNCPECGLKMPARRKPTSFRQAIAGGWTCPRCRCEMDKWGRNLLA